MIGHYLLTLTPKQEDRVLTMPMGRAPSFIADNGCRCLVGTVQDFDHDRARQEVLRLWDGYRQRPPGSRRIYVGAWYDRLCARFGDQRINAAIRQRILTNRLWRTLHIRAYSESTTETP